MNSRQLDLPLVRSLWLLFAATCPLFAVSLLRLDAGFFLPVPLPLLVLGLIAAIHITTRLARRGGAEPQRDHPSRTTFLLILVGVLCFVLFVWQLYSAGKAKETSYALTEVQKIAVGMVCFLLLVAAFPRDERFLAKFFGVMIWAAAGLMAVLIYQYAVVFGSPYLGSGMDEASEQDKNQLAWNLAFLMPLAIAQISLSKKKALAAPPVCTLIVAWIYVGSRGGWLSATVGIFVAAAILASRDQKAMARLAAMFTGIAVLGLLGGWVLVQVLDVAPDYLASRLGSIDPASEQFGESTALRVELLRNAFDAFEASPVTGVGLTNVRKQGYVTHNDYVALLSETGVVGLALFLSVGAAVWQFVHPKRAEGGQPTMEPWALSGIRGSFVAMGISLLFINAWTTPAFWVFSGLVVSVGMTEPAEPLGDFFQPVSSGPFRQQRILIATHRPRSHL